MTNNSLKGLLATYREIITFAVVGAVNTGIDFAVFSVSLFLLPQINEAAAQAAGYTAGFVISFFLNKYVTFRNNAKSLIQAALFILCNVAVMLLSMLGIYLLHSVIGIQEHLAKLFLITPATMLINFVCYKYVVFAKH